MRLEVVGQTDVEALAESWQMTDQNALVGSHGEPRIRSVAELASIRTYASEPIEFIIDGLIAVGTVAGITGDSGDGKSTFISAICGAVARGVPFAGLVTQCRPVLILDRENPASVVLERFDRLGIQDGDNFKVWGGWAPEEAPSPYSPRIIDWVTACDPKPLIAVDSFISFHPGDENDAAETRQFMQGFRRLADMGATVVFAHHSGKSETSKDYRGSSDIKASVDVGYNLANVGDPSRLSLLRLRAFKARFNVRTEWIFRYHEGIFHLDERPASRTNQEMLQELLVANPEIRKAQFETLARDKGLGRDKARRFLESGVSAGTVREDQGKHNQRLHTWVGLGA